MELKMLTTGELSDSEEAVCYSGDIHSDSPDIDVFGRSAILASQNLCSSFPCSPPSLHSCDDPRILSLRSDHIHHYIETERPYTPPLSSASSVAGHCTMSCTEGDLAESVAETENTNDEDGMSDEDIPLDSMDIIMQRAAILLKLTPESSYLNQGQSEYTCLLGAASIRLSPETNNQICDGHYGGGDARKTTIQEWSTVRRQYAQALILFYRSGPLWDIPTIDAIPSRKRLSIEGCLSSTIGSLTNKGILEDFRHEFMCHIWRAGVRWLASIVVTGKLPGNEVVGEEELRLEFWETQLDDEALRHILWVLRPGLDIDSCLKVVELRGCLYSIVIQLIDDLFCFKLGRMSDLITDEYIVARFEDDSFRQAMNDVWGVKIEEIPVGGLLAKCLSLHSVEED